NFFTSLIDIYFIGSRVKRRVFKTLSSFRLCYSYYSANRIINSIAKEVEVLVIYNNINFKDIKRDKLLSYTSVIHSLITTAIIFYPKLPLTRLRQLIHNPIKPL
ncbi:uncharacterized protein K441DRAFT_594047, partial [Cenococcum geophilum 1.58]